MVNIAVLVSGGGTNPGDTPEMLQKRVMAQAEHILLPHVVSLFCEGKLSVSEDGIVSISE